MSLERKHRITSEDNASCRFVKNNFKQIPAQIVRLIRLKSVSRFKRFLLKSTGTQTQFSDETFDCCPLSNQIKRNKNTKGKTNFFLTIK